MAEHQMLIQRFSDAVRDLAYCDSPGVGYFTRVDEARASLVDLVESQAAEIERLRATIDGGDYGPVQRVRMVEAPEDTPDGDRS